MPARSEVGVPLLGGTVRVGADVADSTTRSYLSDGRVVGWWGPAGVVIDAEIVRDPPRAAARRFGAYRFWPRWTTAECAAKAHHVPIALWLSTRGLCGCGCEGAQWAEVQVGGVVVTGLWCPSRA